MFRNVGCDVTEDRCSMLHGTVPSDTRDVGLHVYHSSYSVKQLCWLL